ncbi:MAG: DUF2087 domain-containing protein [Cellulosilyticaceae bacterium]
MGFFLFDKKKIVILEKIATSFKKGKIYSEIEINRILEQTGLSTVN